MKIHLPTLECLRCGHMWHPKKESMPMCCAFCKSPYWKIPSEKTSDAMRKHTDGCEPCRESR
jgi:predicted  nucleic acid-binding Zn-ribbon protein